MTSPANLLDDYLASIENLPFELQQQLAILAEKDLVFEDSRRGLFKKRSLLLRAEEKGIGLELQYSLLKKSDKDAIKATAAIEEKLVMTLRLQKLIEQHLARLDNELERGLSLRFENGYEDALSGLPDPSGRAALEPTFSSARDSATPIKQNPSQSVSSIHTPLPIPSSMTSNTPDDPLSNISNVKASPRKRQNLTDEPVDPNEPVYCYCAQVSWGDMVGCDNPSCSREWFHYSCVGLTAPPKGKWYCRDCQGAST